MPAAGLKIVLPATFTDPTLPVLHDDSILAAGSLYLMDLAHSANPVTAMNLTSGLPADGAVVNNVAYKECAALLGSGTQATLSGSVLVKGSINNGSKGKVERSSKGGLHTIVSQSVLLTQGDGVGFQIPAVIRAYILANITHSFFFSTWDYLTRIHLNVGTGGFAFSECGLGITPAAGLSFARTGYALSNGSGNTLGTRGYPGGNTLGGRITNEAHVPTGLTSVNPTVSGPIAGIPVNTQNSTLFNIWGNSYVNFPSQIAYRFYIEDLTVSGRTYATVDALDFAKYTADVLTAGGRYYGDTFTAPSTIA